MAGGTKQPLCGIVLGLGVMGTHHVRVLGTLPDVELVAAVDPNADRRAAAAAAFPRISTHASLEEALAEHGDVDFAAVAVPVEHLPQAARAALAADLHALVEKPTAPTEEQAVELAREADARGLKLAVGYVERFNPAVAMLKRKLDEGAIGHVLQMQASRLSPFPNRDSMHGVALDLATHDIDVMRYLTGSEVARVYAETAQRVHQRAEDLLCATLRFDDGTTGLLEVNWLTPAKVRRLAATGEQGMLTVDYLTQEVCLYKHPTSATNWDTLSAIRGGGEGDMVRFALDRDEPLRREWQQFLDAVRDDRPVPVSAYDGAAALSTARAIREAGSSHQVVTPEYRRAGVG